MKNDFDNLNLFISKHSSEIWKFSDLEKLSILIQTEFFKFLWKFCVYLWDIHSFKDDSIVRRSSYEVNKKTESRVLLWHMKKYSIAIKIYIKISSSLSRVDLRRLQDKCNSLWTFVFNYCISNNLQNKNTVIQM